MLHKPNIAFFDSGQGGLTIWENVVKHFPHINTMYLGDNARCPYGNKSPETIVRYTHQAGTFLESKNAKLFIIVCGTASSVATQYMQKTLNIPVIGIVEGLCEYAHDLLKDKSKPIAILATRYTIKSERFKQELNRYGIQNIWSRECPLFVPLIEEGISDGEIVHQACDLYLKDIPQDVKIVVLACTHYPRIVNAIGKYLTHKTGRSVFLKTWSEDVQISGSSSSNDPILLIDASTPIIKRVEHFLSQNEFDFEGQHRTLCTDSPAQFGKVANYFTQLPLPKIEHVEISEIIGS